MLLLNSLAPYGAETFALNHACHASRRDFDVTVCHFGGSTSLAEKFREAGIGVFCLGERRRPSALASARLAVLLRRERVDVLQTHIGYASVMGRVVGRAVGVPVVVSTEQTVRNDYPPLTRRANDLTFPLAHENVFISQAVVRSFGGVFPHVVRQSPTIITNGIDARPIAALSAAERNRARAELGIAPGEFVYGSVGRLMPKKGHRFAVKALAQVRARLPSASLWIVGGGELDAELRRLAVEEGVERHVHFLGQRLDVHRILGAFDAYVHPSTTEALGIAVLEAMAAGLPTIAAAVDGIPEFVRDGDTGWLFPSADVDRLAVQMLVVGLQPAAARVTATRGQELIFREHDIRVSVTAYEELYQRLLGPKYSRHAA